MAQGYQVFVYPGGNVDTDPVMADDMVDDRGGVQVDSAALLKALDHIRQLEQEKTQLAGQVGFLQAKLQDAEERIRLLEAPKEPEEETPAAPVRDDRPWWERLRSRLKRT